MLRDGVVALATRKFCRPLPPSLISPLRVIRTMLDLGIHGPRPGSKNQGALDFTRASRAAGLPAPRL